MFQNSDYALKIKKAWTITDFNYFVTGHYPSKYDFFISCLPYSSIQRQLKSLRLVASKMWGIPSAFQLAIKVDSSDDKNGSSQNEKEKSTKAKKKILFVSCNGLKRNRVGRGVRKNSLFWGSKMCFLHVLHWLGVRRAEKTLGLGLFLIKTC